jgi:hypothetical protein
VRSELTAEDVRKLLRYDPKTGKMFLRLRPNGRVPEGSEAGTVTRGCTRSLRAGIEGSARLICSNSLMGKYNGKGKEQ